MPLKANFRYPKQQGNRQEDLKENLLPDNDYVTQAFQITLNAGTSLSVFSEKNRIFYMKKLTISKLGGAANIKVTFSDIQARFIIGAIDADQEFTYDFEQELRFIQDMNVSHDGAGAETLVLNIMGFFNKPLSA